MTNSAKIQLENSHKFWKNIQYNSFKMPILGMAFVLGMVSVTLSITILIKMNTKISDNISDRGKFMINAKSFQQSSDSVLGDSMSIDEVLSYLNELHRIGKVETKTRGTGSTGFNATIDYIYNYLAANTNYKMTKTSFYVISPYLASAPIFMSAINGAVTNHTFSSHPTAADFFYAEFTRSTTFTNYVELTVIPNGGCSEADWRFAKPVPTDRVALVKRGNCSYLQKSELATKYNITALLIYNDGTSPNGMIPLFISLGENNTLPALFLSYQLGNKLATAAEQKSGSVRVLLNIRRRLDGPSLATNLCADTPTGDPTQTIVIGSHSDSVAEGPGINDNGSGSAANLGLAVALARLFRTQAYPKYKYRVRFCWWGAEELGLLGSEHYINQAKHSAVVGERLSDNLVNLNYDMLGSPNYMFGIYDGKTANNATPPRALPGSNKVTALYRDWFIRQNLPWEYTDLTGYSDYGPFLAEGIVAGGLFAGANEMKSQEDRDRYDEVLGQGLGGISGIIHDPCYHRACDTIQNINKFGYEKMVKAAAYVLESLGRKNDLKEWLYPLINLQRANARSQTQDKAIRRFSSLKKHFDIFLPE